MMEGWKKDKFKNQIQNKSGYTWSKEQELKTKAINSVRVLTVSNIQTELDLSEELYLQNVSDKDKNEKIVNKDWCIAVSSNGNRKRIGNAVFIKNDMDYLFASFLTALKPKDSSDILPEYFFRWLTSYNVQERISSVSEGTTGLGNLDMRYLRNIDINYPESPTEQASIAKHLSKVDEAIESVKKSIEAAEKLKKSLMQNLLTGRMKPDGTFRTEEEFYEDEKFGKVPIGWEVKKVKELFYINRLSLSNKTDDNYRFKYITIENVSTEYIDFANCQEFLFKDSPGRARRYIISNDILISGVRPNLKAFAIYQRPDSNEWICSTGFHVLTAKDKVSSQFFYYQILSSIGESQFYSFVAGSNYPAIGDSDMKRMLLLVPPYDEQKTISKKIEDVSFYQKQKKEKIITLERLKKSLMQNLLTGKVRVGEEGK